MDPASFDANVNGVRRDRTYVDDVLATAARQPDKAAVVSYVTGRAAPEVLTYGELAVLVDRGARALVDLGVRHGDVVALQLPNGWRFVVAALAAARAGAVVNPLVPILRQRELRFILDRTRARVFLVPELFRGHDHGSMARELGAELASLEHVVVLGDGPDEPFFGPAADPSSSPDAVTDAELDARRLEPAEVAEVQFTSGTTGEPKGVIHTGHTLWAAAETLRQGLDLGASDVVLMSSTLAHQTGYLYGFVMPLAWGMTAVYQDVWNGEEGVRIMAEQGVTFTMGATPFVMDAVAAQRRERRDVTTLRFFVCGGAPVPPHLVPACREELGADLVAVWGMTENGAVTLTRPADGPDLAADSDGIPTPWNQVRVVDGGGDDLPVGEPGRLLVRGASQTPGYFGRPDLYEACLTADPDGGDPWFDTGDLARMRDDGGIRIVGRLKDLIIRGGENVPAVEVEGVLYLHPKVRECAVVGVPDDRLGERACAVVIATDAADPPTLAELAEHCRVEGMARQFWPERVEVVDDFPRTPSGKVQKFRLRELLDSASV